MSACGLRASAASQVVTESGQPHAARSRGRAAISAARSPRRPAIATASSWTTTRRCIRIRRRAFSRTGRTARPRSSIRGAFPGPTTTWQGVAPRRPGRLRDARRHVHARGHVGRRGARSCRSWRGLGITMIEVMPVAEFDGRFGWGYDGVDLFAPTHLYGAPDDFRRFVDTAHALRRRRHPRRRLQPSRAGRQLPARVLAGVLHRPVRERVGRRDQLRRRRTRGRSASSSSRTPATGSTSFISTACASTRRSRSSTRRPSTSSTAIGRARARGGGRHGRSSSSPRTSRRTRGWCGRSREGGYGLDALWNDDFHHSAMVALTGRAEAYYSDTAASRRSSSRPRSTAICFRASTTTGSGSRAARRRWGLPPAAFVVFLQNHDQVANSARGLRGHQLTSPGRWRAMTALLLLSPGTPMLFQGQEFSASAPFLYFADFEPELAAAVRKGRARVPARSFRASPTSSAAATLADPGDPATFERCKLDLAERETHAAAYALHVDLLRAAARGRGVPRCSSRAASTARCSSRSAFALRFFTADHVDDRLLDRQPRSRPAARRRSPSRCWRRRPDADWIVPVVERGPRVRRQRHAGSVARRALASFRARARSCCSPGPQRSSNAFVAASAGRRESTRA